MLTAIVKRLPNLLFGLRVWGSSFFRPKRRDLWVFGAWEGDRFADNASFLFRYTHETNREINCVWVTRNKDIFENLRANDLPVVMPNTREGAKILSQASIAFSTHGMHDFGGGLSAKAKLIYLSHGIPLKKIGYDVESRKLLHSKWVRKVSEILPMFRRPDYVICSDDLSMTRFHSSLRVPCEKIVSIGFSRWRPIYESLGSPKLGPHTKILYAPTLRGFGHAALQFCEGEEAPRLAQALRKLGAKMYIRPHPALRLFGWKEAIQKYPDVFVDFSAEVRNEINEVLGEFDVLIADYSSLIFDYKILERSILSLVPDLDEYCKQSPGVYGEYRDSVPGPIFYKWDDLIEYIEANPDTLVRKNGLIDGKATANLVDKKIVNFAKTVNI